MLVSGSSLGTFAVVSTGFSTMVTVVGSGLVMGKTFSQMFPPSFSCSP